MTQIAIVYHSGYGHTKAQAEAELKLLKRDFDLDRFLGGRQ